MTKKSKFVFTFDIDTVLLKLIVKYRQDIYSRGSTCKGWNLILDEFNSILNSSIVQSRTLNNRFKVLRKDLNLRISNDLVKPAGLNENEKLLVFLNSFFSSKSGKLAEKEKEKGLLIDGKKLDIELDNSRYHEDVNVPIDELNQEIESEISNEMNNEMNNNIIDVNAGQNHQENHQEHTVQDHNNHPDHTVQDHNNHQEHAVQDHNNHQSHDNHQNHDHESGNNPTHQTRDNSSMSPKINRRGSYQMLQYQMELNNMMPQNQLAIQSNQIPQNVYPMYHNSPNSSISSQMIPDHMSPNYNEIDKDHMNMTMNNGFEMYSPKQNLDYYYYETKNRKKEYRPKRSKPNPRNETNGDSPSLNREGYRAQSSQYPYRRLPHLQNPPTQTQNPNPNQNQQNQTQSQQNSNQTQNHNQQTQIHQPLKQTQLINDLQQTQAKHSQELNEFRKEFYDFKYQVGSRLDQILQSLQKN